MCAKKIYGQSGLHYNGKLNPDNTNSWPSGWVSSWFKNGQRGSFTLGYYRWLLNWYRRLNVIDSINPKNNFDRYIYTNQLVKGENPPIPWEKPCWKEFIKMMTTTEYIKLMDNGNLDFSGNTGGGFKAILPQSWQAKAKDGPQKGMYWVNGYQLKKEIYEMKYFPFWQFVKTNKSVWNSRWWLFKRKMLSVYGVKASGDKKNMVWYGWDPWKAKRGVLQKGEGDCDSDRDCAGNLRCYHDRIAPGLKNTGAWRYGRDFCYDPNDSVLDGTDAIRFKNGSIFDTVVETTSNLSDANRSGKFYRSGNYKMLTKQAYMTENFPYWSFLRKAERG